MTDQIANALDTLPDGLLRSSGIRVESGKQCRLCTYCERAGHRFEKNAAAGTVLAVHEAIIAQLGIKVIACFGATAGRWVRERLSATELVDSVIERNARRWRSFWHRSPDGRSVITLTHPGRADWRNPDADPTELVRMAIGAKAL